MVSTRAVTDRRSLRFDAMEGIFADIEALDGTRARTTGNWTAGQIVLHVSRVIGASLDGFGYRLPLPIRVLARLGKERTLRGGMKPGLPVPKRLSRLRPGPEVTWDDALADLRDNTRRIGGGRADDRGEPALRSDDPPGMGPAALPARRAALELRARGVRSLPYQFPAPVSRTSFPHRPPAPRLTPPLPPGSRAGSPPRRGRRARPSSAGASGHCGRAAPTPRRW